MNWCYKKIVYHRFKKFWILTTIFSYVFVVKGEIWEIILNFLSEELKQKNYCNAVCFFFSVLKYFSY